MLLGFRVRKGPCRLVSLGMPASEDGHALNPKAMTAFGAKGLCAALVLLEGYLIMHILMEVIS